MTHPCIIHKIRKVILYLTGMFLCKDNPLQIADAFNYSMCLLNLFDSFGTLIQLASNMACLEDVLLLSLVVWNGEIHCRNNT